MWSGGVVVNRFKGDGSSAGTPERTATVAATSSAWELILKHVLHFHIHLCEENRLVILGLQKHTNQCLYVLYVLYVLAQTGLP